MILPKLRFLLFLLSSFGLLLSPLLSFAEDYSNNIGFMKNPPKELKEKFPMCDQFLDVKWIKQFPEGNWVGMVTADIYRYDKKERRELVVMQRHYQGGGFVQKEVLDAFDVSESNFKGNSLELVITSSDYAFSAYWSRTSEKTWKGFAVEANGKLTEVTMNKGYPNGRGNYNQETQNVCVILPSKESGWLIENKLGRYGSPYIHSNDSKEDNHRK